MKIALAVQRFPHGGAESYVEQIANRLHLRGHDVTVITSQQDYDDSNYGFKIIRLPHFLSVGEYSFWSGLGSVLKGGFELVHINSYGYFHSDYTAYLKRKYRYKLVMTSHGFAGIEIHRLKRYQHDIQESGFGYIRPFYDRFIGRKTVLACDRLIALSKRDVEYYSNFGCSESKITIIPPGVRDSFFLPPEGADNLRAEFDAAPLILSVGELSRVKAQAVAIKAMPAILEKKPRAKLLLIGRDRAELQTLTNLSNRLGLEKHVLFLGPKSESEVRNYMHSADLLVHTSLAEGVSTVLLEAMSCGLPFVTTPAGGNGYLAEESRAGLTIPFNDEVRLADTVAELSSNEKRLHTLRANGRLYTNDLSWDKVFPTIMNIYRDCLLGNAI